MPTNAQVTLSAGSLVPGYCYPASPQDLLNAFVAVISGYLPGNYSTFNFGSAVPSPDDQDKPWIKTDNSGYLVGLYVYVGGVWARPHAVPPSSAQDIIWKDTEAALWSFDGGDGTDPGSFPPTATTGAMWQRDTDFGSSTTGFRFPVGIGTNATAYDTNPATTIGVGQVGGLERNLLVTSNIPNINLQLGATTGTNNVITCVDGTGPVLNGPGIGLDPIQNAPAVQTVLGTGTVTTVNGLPPYIGVIFAKRTARQFYTS